MEDLLMKCPLCCDKKFSSRLLLAEHLSNIISNLICPICKNKWSSIAHLIEHLNLDDCQPDRIVESLGIPVLEDRSNQNVTENSISESKAFVNGSVIKSEDLEQVSVETVTEESKEIDSKMYVELLSKQLTKPCLQTQELKFVEEDGESRYVIMEQEDSDLNLENTVVTKQNNDGTISLTTVKVSDLEVDQGTTETEAEETSEEIYSCNTCGVSFSSVIDHIQNYHNDQEVVVEEPLEEADNESNGISIQLDPLAKNGHPPNDTVVPRRMITDTGSIVEAPLYLKHTTVLLSDVPSDSIKENIGEKRGRPPAKRYVQIEKFCDSIVKDINQSDEKGGPYHKVTVKDVKTTDGNDIKMYHCMSCDIYVGNLEEFKSYTCKTLKFSCPHCPVAYENSKSLSAHMKAHKSKDKADTIYECEICNTIFPTNKSLKLHKRMHDPIKSRPIDPPVTTAEGEETDSARYMCTICEKMIPVDYKTIHQNSHKHDNKMNCSVCNKKFQSNEYLEMHMSVHNLDKVPVSKTDKSLPYSCLYCTRRFARPHEKVKHERIHTGEKPHECEICGKSFRVSYCLTLHMRTHTGARPYACTHCGKRFKAHSVYNHHLLTHSEVRAYKCPYCPKAFKTSVQLAGHKNSHTKPFSCQHCNRPFASLYAVRVHTETHLRQNNLKFSCDLCGASYARAFALKDHVKQVHKQEIDDSDQAAPLSSDWSIAENVESDATIQTLDKDLSTEVTILEMNATELIVP
ncbi:zinc finger protein 624-like [Achroia grisella]|uniref:zinc finger protein 624-like n=1 Tax=Achroia grisella TaxID=688607 RepID=UPI0027D2FDBA|nr:zinc finger protein 624-like [Achroia grisella]